MTLTHDLTIRVLLGLTIGAGSFLNTQPVFAAPHSKYTAYHPQTVRITSHTNAATSHSKIDQPINKRRTPATTHPNQPSATRIHKEHLYHLRKPRTSQTKPKKAFVIYRTQAHRAQLQGPHDPTLILRLPIMTQDKLQTKHFTHGQLEHWQVHVTSQIWTNHGQYYQLTGLDHFRAWISVAQAQLQPIKKTAPIVPHIRKKTQQPAKTTSTHQGDHSTKSIIRPKTPTHSGTTTQTTSKTSPTNPTVTPPAVKKPSTPKVTTGKQPTTPVTPTHKYTAAQALSAINTLIAQNHFTGTLLVTNNGTAGTKTFSYGQANIAANTANVNDEAYPLASLEKSLTGAIIQRLIDEHKLTMNTTLATYYPQIKFANTITIRELLDHTSGIQMGEPVPTTAITNENDAVAFTIKNLTSTGQYVWHYSNANFTLLAGIIHQITGQTFMTNLQTDILQPLGMTHTYLYNQVPTNAVKPLSYHYSSGTSTPVDISTNLLSSELGCGNVYASVGDFYTFISNLVDGRLDTAAGYQQLANNFQPAYAGGIYYRPNNIIRIGGADNGYRSYYFGTSDGKVAVVLFANQGAWSTGNIIDEQIEQILAQSDPL